MNKQIQAIKLIFSAVLFIILGFYIWHNFISKTIFNITVETERVDYKTTKSQAISRIDLTDVEIASSDRILYNNFSGSFELGQDVNVLIERITYGSIYISLNCNSCISVGKLFHIDDSKLAYVAGDFLDIIISNIKENADKGITNTFIINGKINIGRKIAVDLSNESKAVLREGKILMTSKSIFGDSYYDAGSSSLNLGDNISLKDSKMVGYGFVVINEKPGMELAFRIIEKKIELIKPGPDSKIRNSLRASFLSRIKRDPILNYISFIIGVLIFFINISTYYMDVTIFSKNDLPRKQSIKMKKKSKRKEK